MVAYAYEDDVVPMHGPADDFLADSSRSQQHPGSRRSRGGRDSPSPPPTRRRSADATSSFPAPRPRTIFPKQLLEVLSDPCSAGIIEWLAHGHAFAIKKTDRFAKDIMPRFTRGKLTSFQRQLNLYGFRKVTKGTDCKAGTLVYFHPAFKRGRPEMMEGIKRIACKGDLSLNRLRNDAVPYDATVPSEEAEAPEQDVNSLEVDEHKRMRGWQSEESARKRARPAVHAHQDAYDISPRRLNEGLRRALPQMDDAYLVKEIQPDMLSTDLDTILNADLAVRPTAPPAVQLGDLPIHGTNFVSNTSAFNEMQRCYPTCDAVQPRGSHSHVNREARLGTLTSGVAMMPLYAHHHTATKLPRSSHVSQPLCYASPPQHFEADEPARAAEEYGHAAEQLTTPPPKSRFTDIAVENLLPLPFQRRSSSAAETVPPNLRFGKRMDTGASSMGKEVLMRNVSELSGFSNASDLWRGCEELEKDIDFAGLFE